MLLSRESLAAAIQLEILDLRHYSAQTLRPVLEEESRIWSQTLSWDYQGSTDLLLQYLDARVLPGFVAVEAGRVIGYAFCVYEDRKAIVGDVFALPPTQPGTTRAQVELVLLEHLLSLLTHSPGVERIESQMLLHVHRRHSAIFQKAGFDVYRRLFLERRLSGLAPTPDDDPASLVQSTLFQKNGYHMRCWQESDFSKAAALITGAFAGHLDSVINDQYQSIAGALRFLHNIIRFPGCGLFDAEASRVVEHPESGRLIGILLCSRVRRDVGHITQACVEESARGAGLGTLMLESTMRELARRNFSRLSLTVTEGNSSAARLYQRLGFEEQHSFDAMVWTRDGLHSNARSRTGHKES